MKLKINSNPNIYFDTETLYSSCFGVECFKCPFNYRINNGASCRDTASKKAFKLLENNIKELIDLL